MNHIFQGGLYNSPMPHKRSLPHIEQSCVSRIFAAFAEGKNFKRNLCTKLSQDVMESGGSEFSQCFTLSFSENGKSLKQIASLVTPLYFIVSHTSKKLEKCVLGFSFGNPMN